MTCLEAALIVLALGTALPALAHTLLEVRRSHHRPRHWLTMENNVACSIRSSVQNG
jgi:hypothetical protein